MHAVTPAPRWFAARPVPRSASAGTVLRGCRRSTWLLAPLVLLAACSTPPRIDATRDGPPAQPPPDLSARPDPQPQVEPIRPGGPNKPYEVLGQRYTPLAADLPLAETGLASWYGRKFHGRRTASGEVYDMYATTAAHRTMPLPSYALVRNPANGREVIVRVNDRGPFHAGRIVDLSYTAALKLDLLRGVAPVELERITAEQIRSGAWRRPAPDTQVASAAPGTASAAAPAESVPVTVPLAPVALAETTPAPPPAGIPRRAYTAAGRGYWLQLGAFRDRQGAEAFQRHIATELDWLAPLMTVFNEASVHRLQAGPYPTRSAAGKAQQLVRASLQLSPIIVERR